MVDNEERRKNASKRSLQDPSEEFVTEIDAEGSGEISRLSR